MKIASNIAGVLLGLLFIAASSVVLFKIGPTPPPPPESSPAGHFMAAFATTGYLTFVKIFELLGGLLVAIPRTRNLGLLVLGPIILNILAFHSFVTGGEGLFNPLVIGICLLALFLLWVERHAFACLITRPLGSKLQS
jgi:putative oxidoreductase